MTDSAGGVPGWNLVLRAALEFGALLGWGWVGQHLAGGLLAFVLPIVVAIVWIAFAVPGDQSRSGRAPVPVPGWLRLSIESLAFAGGAVGASLSGVPVLGAIFAAAVAVHLAFSTDRIRWLLDQR